MYMYIFKKLHYVFWLPIFLRKAFERCQIFFLFMINMFRHLHYIFHKTTSFFIPLFDPCSRVFCLTLPSKNGYFKNSPVSSWHSSNDIGGSSIPTERFVLKVQAHPVMRSN